ncbi:flagellar motor switch protein FliG [Permianibacter sp. IMCC34836]|uniref:flagellar motor switch protein FliG n=1 Tax=Permianibacter fluminis TaxID=2738515 RepID=UPI0015548148|nr:flagellar motor switch protein FliG [Permianibacter fluminis]NQD38038.1 flagellar motor switch protein FliG [Permianibacter fluminis]
MPENPVAEKKPTEGEKKELSVDRFNNTEQAAILLLSLGEDHAAQVLKHMGPKEVQRIGLAMAAVKHVERNDVDHVVNKFLIEVEKQTGIGIGTEEYIRNTLRAALGSDKADALCDRILAGANTKGLDTLKWMDARAVADLIRYEHPQIQTIVLAYLDPDQSAEVLSQFPDKVRLDLTMRIASLESVQPAALTELNNIMERQLSGQTGSKSAALGGTKRTADIINFLDGSVQSALIDQIKQVDEDLSQKIQDLMFVFENLVEVDDRGIQTLLREVSTEVLITALKGSDETVREKIFKNMSKRAAELMREDLSSMGPVKLSDVEKAQKEILTVARRMADAGEIVLGGSGEQMV